MAVELQRCVQEIEIFGVNKMDGKISKMCLRVKIAQIFFVKRTISSIPCKM